MGNEIDQKVKTSRNKGRISKDPDWFASAPAGCLVISKKGGVVDMNQIASDLIGIDRSQMRNFPFIKLISQESIPGYTRFINRIFHRNSIQSVSIALGADNKSKRHLYLTGNRGDSGEICLVNLFDLTDQKLAEEKMRYNEESFRKLTQSASDAIITINDQGIITEWNIGAEKIFGYKEKEIIGKELSVIIPRKYIRKHKNSIQRIAQGGDFNIVGKMVERQALNKYKEEFPVEISLASWETMTGKFFTGIIRDITERKLISDTQKFLLECGLPGSGEDFFEALAKYLSRSLKMGYVCIDRLEGDGLTAQTLAIFNEGKFETNTLYALKDTPCGEVVGKTVCCFPDNVCRLFPNDTVLQDLKAKSYIGTTLWSFDRKALGLIAVIGRKPLKKPGLAEAVLQTVAIRAAGELERLQNEEKLKMLNEELEVRVKERTAELSRSYAAMQKSEEKFRTVADYLFDWEYWINPDETYNYISPSCAQITGYTAQEFMDDPQLIYKIIHPDDKMGYVRHVAKQLREMEACEEEFRIMTKDGRERWIGHVCQPVFGNSGEFLGKRGSNRDITEKVKAESELLNVTTEIEERERNNISSELHDGLGPLLSTIKLYFQWLAETDDPEKIKIITEKGNYNIERAIQTIREVTHGLSSLVLNEMGYVDAVINFIQIVNDTGKLTINFTYNSKERFENLLETTLYRITTELVNNTIKYADASHAEIVYHYNKSKNKVTFKYTDDGIGFDPADAYKTAKGLGLMNIQQRIKILKGEIIVQSEHGKGILVNLQIPVK